MCRQSADVVVESIRLLDSVDPSVGDTTMVATSDSPEEGITSRLAVLFYRPSIGVPHEASQAAVPHDDQGDHVFVKVFPFRTVDAVV